jgi:hypothetical protein
MIRRIPRRIGLNIHQLQQKRRPLYAVGVPNAWLRGAEPREVNTFSAGGFNLRQTGGREFRNKIAAVRREQGLKLLALRVGEF